MISHVSESRKRPILYLVRTLCANRRVGIARGSASQRDLTRLHPTVMTVPPCALCFRFNTVPGYDGAGSHAERAQRLSAGEAFALPERALQGDIPMLARRSRPQTGISDLTQGSRPAAGGQHERTLRGPRELCFRVHRLRRKKAGGPVGLFSSASSENRSRDETRIAAREGVSRDTKLGDVSIDLKAIFSRTKRNCGIPFLDKKIEF